MGGGSVGWGSDGAVMMVPESLLAFVDEVKMIGQLENPKRRF
jgi:hypothetical protein